jgi:hypothetical protein
MKRVLIVAAIALGSIAGLGCGGGSALNVHDAGRAGVGGDATAGAGALDAPGAHVADAVASDVPVLDVAVEHADAAPGVDVGVDHAIVPDAPAVDPRDAAGDGAVDVATDAGTADAKRWDALPTDWLAFDVIATVMLTPDAQQATAWATFPTTVRFSMGWLPQPARLIINGGATAETWTADDTVFRVQGGVNVDVPFPPGCNAGGLQFDTMTFFFGADGLLRGSATGTATYWMGDAVWQAPATFTLSGGPDVTPPTLTPVNGVVDPFGPLWLEASEALAPTATVTLVGMTSGDRVVLTPQLDDGVYDKAVTSFAAPDGLLRWGEVYKVETAGAVDLAGNALAFTTPPTETTPPAPPLQAEDGFESVTGTTYAAVGVLKGGPLAPIDGTTSLVVGNGVSFLSSTPGTLLRLRLAVAPGDTVVRFAARLDTVAASTDVAFRGVIYVGVVGGSVQAQTDIVSNDYSQVSLGASGTVTESAVQTVEIPLPADATSEVSLEILTEPNDCGAPYPPTWLVVDDLRVE